MGEPVELEASGETVGEAKWLGLRELEKRFPGLDRSLVTFEVLSEGERGLLGVGTAPARVLARVDPETVTERVAEPRDGESPVTADVREVLEEIVRALGADCRVDVEEAGGEISATFSGPGVAVLIGKRGKTIDSIQYLVSSIAAGVGEQGPRVTVDAADYRGRRESRLVDLAERSAERVRRTGQPVSLEPMTSTERKIVHMHLKDEPGIATSSVGDEPNRYVVIAPAAGD